MKKRDVVNYDIKKGKTNKTYYQKEMKLAILSCIKRNYDTKGYYDMQIINNQVFLGGKMVNENYLIAAKETSCTSDILEASTENLYNFSTVGGIFRRGFERTLISLKEE